MKSAVFCVLALVVVAVAALPPIPTLLQQQDGVVLAVEEYDAPEEVHGLRYRRATCDLLSFSSKLVTPNHFGCALHCMFMGYKRGNCQDTVCYCSR